MSSKKCSSGIKFSDVYDFMKKTGGIKTQKEFTELLGIGPQTLTKYKITKKKSMGWREPDIPGDWIIKWAIKTNSSIDDLLKSFLKPKSVKMVALEDGKPAVKGTEIAIPYAWKESGEMPDLEKIIMELARIWLDTYFSENKRHLIAWVAKSDNMNGPNKDSIERNSLVLIDTRKKNIEGSGIYAFTTEGGIEIRRISRRITGALDITEDNPAYQNRQQFLDGKNETMTMEGISILGRVVFIGRIT
ncbi:MAG: hypothetical protein A3K30_03145 [Deltaproteobacteria bacterium RBG_13_51_10]|nr:MAG: hypothetical protein A3K30_03145 [Deltaproteobacteria bacterium RBG_13_51_10]